MSLLLSSYELHQRLAHLRKEEVKALYDAAVDVARGSDQAVLQETAQTILQQVRTLYPQWVA